MNRKSLLYFILNLLIIFPLYADFNETYFRSKIESREFQWKYDAAKNALNYGLNETALEILEKLLKYEFIKNESDVKDNIRILYIKALIGNQEFKKARENINLISSPKYYNSLETYSLIISYLGDFKYKRKEFKKTLKSYFRNVEISKLDESDKAWYFFFKSISNQLEKKSYESISILEESKKRSLSISQKAFFNSLILRLSFSKDEPSSKSVKSLRKLWRSNRDDKNAYIYTYDYAYILALNNDRNRAIEILNDELKKGVFYSSYELDNLRLLKAIILGPDSKSGRELLVTLMQLSENALILDRSFDLFIRYNKDSKKDEFVKLVEEFLDNQLNNPLRLRFHLLKLDLLFERAELSRLDEDKILLGEYLSYLKIEAEFILENFPGIDSLSEVYKILAYVALNQEESQYRLAADYLGKFLNTTTTQNDHFYLTKLIGDCYYLNQDYTLSNDYYWSILSNNKNYLDQETLGDIWLSMIISKIKLGEIEQAFKLIDNSIDLNEFPIVYYWKMVWNLSIALEKNGLFEEAKDRLEFLFKDSKETDIPIDFIIRFKWRSLYLRYMLGLDNEDSVTMSDKLLAELNDKSLDFIDRSELDLMKSQVILFKGRFLLYSNRIVKGLSTLDFLKEKYPNTKAAELSYIIIANYYTSIGSLDMAESILLDLAKKYPRSKFAPEAILDAAINAEVQNPNDYKKIILLLDQIVLNYEDSPFVFFAMRHQGDLFRNSGDFVSALSIYENLIQKFPKHENIYLAELSRLDCLSALANENSLYELNDVIIDLERLLDLPNLPNEFQLEVSYKLALMFKNINNIDQSIKISLNCLDEYLNFIPGNSSYNSIGRYWIARSMLLLSDNLISVGRHEETKKIYRLMIEYNLPGKEFVEKMILEI